MREETKIIILLAVIVLTALTIIAEGYSNILSRYYYSLY